MIFGRVPKACGYTTQAVKDLGAVLPSFKKVCVEFLGCEDGRQARTYIQKYLKLPDHVKDLEARRSSPTLPVILVQLEPGEWKWVGGSTELQVWLSNQQLAKRESLPGTANQLQFLTQATNPASMRPGHVLIYCKHDQINRYNDMTNIKHQEWLLQQLFDLDAR